MAHRRLMLQICLIVQDLPDNERDELARDLILNDLEDIEEPDELPRLADYGDADDFGLLVADFIGDPENCREMFAGSDTFVTFHSAQLVSAEWDGAISEDDPINLAGSGLVPIKPQEA